METTTVYGPDGQGYLADKATGRRLHPLETDAPRLAETVAGLQAEIARIKVDSDHSEEWKNKQTAHRQAKIEQYLDGQQGDYYTRALSEFETLQAERQKLLVERRMNDPRGATLPIGLAKLEGIAKTAQNLGEFRAAYEQAQANDPALAFAFQIRGAAWARERWASDRANGSFGKRLERDEASFFESDQTRALLAKMEILQAGVTALNSVSRGFHRQANGVSTPHLGTHTRAIQELQWSIAHYIGEHTALVQPGDDDGRAGGVYWPAAMPTFQEG